MTVLKRGVKSATSVERSKDNPSACLPSQFHAGHAFGNYKSFLNPNHDWLELSRKRMTHPGLTLFGDWDGKAFEPWPETV